MYYIKQKERVAEMWLKFANDVNGKTVEEFALIIEAKTGASQKLIRHQLDILFVRGAILPDGSGIKANPNFVKGD